MYILSVVKFVDIKPQEEERLLNYGRKKVFLKIENALTCAKEWAKKLNAGEIKKADGWGDWWQAYSSSAHIDVYPLKAEDEI